MSNARITAIKNKLIERHLKYPTELELFDDSRRVRCVEDIAKRALATTVISKCAYELFESEDVKQTQQFYTDVLAAFGLEEELFANEKAVLYNAFDPSVCNEVSWEYEAAVALLWAVGMVDTIDDATESGDLPALLNRLFEKVTTFSSMDDFLNGCVLRDEDELADMFQLYWHYHWNIVDGRIFGTMPNTICFDVVYERRRALQWLLYSDESEKGDWDIRMDT